MELTTELLRIMDKPESLIRYVADRPGHDRRYAIDFSKATRELGWAPLVTFEQGLQETVEWYINNGDWIERIRSGEYRQWVKDQYQQRLEHSGSAV